jgi:autotransporter-associated beta strand protein
MTRSFPFQPPISRISADLVNFILSDKMALAGAPPVNTGLPGSTNALRIHFIGIARLWPRAKRPAAAPIHPSATPMLATGRQLVLPLFLVMAGPLPAVMFNRDTGDTKSRELAELPPFASKATATSGCSAVLIAPNVVLSAAHCTSYAASGTTSVEWSGQTRNGAVFTRIGADHIVIVTTSDFTGTTGRMTAPYAGSAEANRLAWKVARGGYGVIGPGSSGPFYDNRFRAMTNRIEVDNVSNPPNAVSASWLFYDFDGPPTQPSGGRATTLHEGGTAPGDSGGPLYMFENGRWFVIGVTSGPDSGFYRDGRVRTDIGQIESITGHRWARPTTPALAMRWVAGDLAAGLADGAPVASWPRRGGSEAWTNAGADGAAGAATLAHQATPLGGAAVAFPGSARLGLAAAANPLAGQTAFSVALVLRADAAGTGDETQWHANTGLLDAEEAGTTNDWGLALAASGQPAVGVGRPDTTIYGNGGPLADGNWHVVVATWDGAEVSGDASGSDLNLNLFVDGTAVARAQGPEFLNVARNAATLALGGSRASARFFTGRIAEVRLYRGALDEAAVAALDGELRAAHLAAKPGLAIARPAGGRASIAAGHGLVIEGSASGAGTVVTLAQAAGPAQATIVPADSLPAHVRFPQAGLYRIDVSATAGGTGTVVPVWVEVLPAGPPPPGGGGATLPLAGPWTAGNLGNANTSGSQTLGATSASLTGSGMGFEEISDSLRFVWQPLRGDGSMTARVTGFSATNGGNAFGGIMLRSSLRRESANVAATLRSGGGLRFSRREEAASYTGITSESLAAPHWLRLRRSGETFTCYHSADGSAWSQLGPVVTLAGAPPVMHAGLLVASFNNNGNSVAHFDNLALEESLAAATGPVLDLPPGQNPAAANGFRLTATCDRPAAFSWTRAAGPAPMAFASQDTNQPQAAPAAAGTYRVRAGADDGAVKTFVEQDFDLSLDARWEFNTPGDAGGWARDGGTGTIEVAGGLLAAPVDATDPQVIHTGPAFISGDLAQRVLVRFRGSATGTAQLFWGRAGAGGFSGARVANLNYASPHAWQVLEFNPSAHSDWAGQVITALRFDPPGGTGSAFEIDWIRLADSPGIPTDDRDGDGVADALETTRHWNASPLDGTWQTGLANWNTKPLGAGFQSAWQAGDDAVFDRPGAYVVGVPADVNPGWLRIAAGEPSFGGAGAVLAGRIEVAGGAVLRGAGGRLFRAGLTDLLLDGTLELSAPPPEAGRLVRLDGGGTVAAGTLRLAGGNFAGAFSGGAAFVKEGPGTLVLTGPNTHAGAGEILAGTVQVGDGGSSGTLGAAAYAHHGAVVFHRSDNSSFDGALAGPGSLAKLGAGTLVLSGPNALGGPVTVAAGTLEVSGAGTLGEGPLALAGTLRVNRSGFLLLGGPVSGSGGLQKLGAGTLALAGANSFGSGTFTLGGGGSNAGYLRLQHPTALGNHTKINLASNTSGVSGVEVAGGHAFAYAIDTAGRNSAAGNVFLRNVAGANQWLGDITITGTGGSYHVESLTGHLTISGRTGVGAGVANQSARSFQVAGAGDTTIAGPLADGPTTPLALTKSGTGTLRLEAANSFTSATTVTGGRLVVNGSSASPVGVAGGGSLGGNGSLANASLAAAAAAQPAVLAPGDGGPGNLGLTGSLTLGAHTRLEWDLTGWNGAPGSAWDKVAATALTLAATPAAPLVIAIQAPAPAGFDGQARAFPVIQAETTSGFNPAAIVVDAAGFAPGGGVWAVRLSGATLELVFTPAGYPAWIAGFPAIADPAPEADPDGDGWNNRDEWVAGTDPTNPASRFTTTVTTAGLAFTRSAGRTYIVESSADLGGWSPHATAPPGTGAVLVPHPVPAGAARFYRVIIGFE